jgi:hypothetical protein
MAEGFGGLLCLATMEKEERELTLGVVVSWVVWANVCCKKRRVSRVSSDVV